MDKIPYVGEMIAKDIFNFCKNGRFKYLENILKDTSPVDILKLVDGVDSKKAQTIVDILHIKSYDDLIKQATKKKIRIFFTQNSPLVDEIMMLLNSLPSWLSYKKRVNLYIEGKRPTTEQLLEWDKMFRKKNPFSAHEFVSLGVSNSNGTGVCSYSHSEGARITHSIGDWVNIQFEIEGYDLKWVILTSKFGELKGKRIVMGEEQESKRYYER